MRLRELAFVFLKLGTTAFGGPAAHIALMEDEVVRRRNWLSREDFLDLLGMTNLIPGPNSTELAIHVGHRRAGWPGLLVAGICFILPAALIVTAIAWAYVRYGQLPAVASVLGGIKPVIVAVVLQALWGLGHSAIKTRRLAVIGLLAAGASFLGMNEVLTLLLAGLAALTVRRGLAGVGLIGGGLTFGQSGLAALSGAVASPFTQSALFLFFLKVGSVLFGSGYVLLAFLRSDLVHRLGWLTEAQLLDATAVGQFTPGPVFTTATFIGYLLSGSTGALLATIGIFLPAFVFVALSAPVIPKLRKSERFGAFLDGVNVASLALMGVVGTYLFKAAVFDWATALILSASAVLLIRFKINSAWLVLGGGALGWLCF